MSFGLVVLCGCPSLSSKGCYSSAFRGIYTDESSSYVISSWTNTLISLLLYNITGGCQTSVKAIWDSTQSMECEFCGQIDTHLHRLPFSTCPCSPCGGYLYVAGTSTFAWFPITSVHPQQILYCAWRKQISWIPSIEVNMNRLPGYCIRFLLPPNPSSAGSHPYRFLLCH